MRAGISSSEEIQLYKLEVSLTLIGDIMEGNRLYEVLRKNGITGVSSEVLPVFDLRPLQSPTGCDMQHLAGPAPEASPA